MLPKIPVAMVTWLLQNGFIFALLASTVITVDTLVVVWTQFGCFIYVYEDSNFGGFRIPHVYTFAHKWREHQASGSYFRISPYRMRSELWRNIFWYFHHLLWFFLYNIIFLVYSILIGWKLCWLILNRHSVPINH